MLQEIYNKLLTPVCALCCHFTTQSYSLCKNCEYTLPILEGNCKKCARVISGSNQNTSFICGQCLQQPPPFERTYALFPYQPPIIKLITGLKFQHQLCHAKILGNLLTKKILADWYRNDALPQILIPIPLHRQRLRERGFNQAVEIARPIAKRCRLKLDCFNTKRIKPTLAQSKLNAMEREKNIKKAFQSSRRFDGLSIAVLDDVITTGQTITEFCKLLKMKGARSIHVWTCARS